MNSVVLKKKDIPELTGLRGIAALGVVIAHFALVAPMLQQYTYLYNFLSICGTLGLSCFFVLSGIVIHYNYAQPIKDNPGQGIIKFLIARFARLYPLYFIYTIGFFIYNLMVYPTNQNPWLSADIQGLPIVLAGMQSWTYAFFNNILLVCLNTEAMANWSISAEMALYFCYLFILLFLGKKFLKLNFMIIFLLAIILRVTTTYFVRYDEGFNEGIVNLFGNNPNYPFWVWFSFWSPWGRLFEFVAGMAIAEFIYAREQENFNIQLYKRIVLAIFLLGLGLLVAQLFMLIPLDISVHLTIPVASSCFVFFIVCYGSSFFRHKILLFMGNTSYSVYLLQTIFIIMYRTTNDASVSKVIMNLILFVASSYFLSYFTFKYYEMPMRKKIRAFFSEH